MIKKSNFFQLMLLLTFFSCQTKKTGSSDSAIKLIERGPQVSYSEGNSWNLHNKSELSGPYYQSDIEPIKNVGSQVAQATTPFGNTYRFYDAKKEDNELRRILNLKHEGILPKDSQHVACCTKFPKKFDGPQNIVGIAINDKNETITYYDDYTYTVGDVNKNLSEHKEYKYTLPFGQVPQNIVAIAISKLPHHKNLVITWYDNLTVSRGTMDDLDKHSDLYSYEMPPRFLPLDIVGISIDSSSTASGSIVRTTYEESPKTEEHKKLIAELHKIAKRRSVSLNQAQTPRLYSNAEIKLLAAKTYAYPNHIDYSERIIADFVNTQDLELNPPGLDLDVVLQPHPILEDSDDSDDETTETPPIDPLRCDAYVIETINNIAKFFLANLELISHVDIGVEEFLNTALAPVTKGTQITMLGIDIEDLLVLFNTKDPDFKAIVEKIFQFLIDLMVAFVETKFNEISQSIYSLLEEDKWSKVQGIVSLTIDILNLVEPANAPILAIKAVVQSIIALEGLIGDALITGKYCVAQSEPESEGS